jgi:hypothetical protein
MRLITQLFYMAARLVQGTQIGSDMTAAWANNAAANTSVTIDIVKPLIPIMSYELTVYNPSTESDLTINVYQKKTALGGGDRYAFLTALNYQKTTTTAKVLEPLFCGGDVRLIISNDTLIGAAGAFTATLRLESVY